MFPRRRRAPTPQQPQPPPQRDTTLAKMKPSSTTPLYHPSIFRYTCRGRLRLDSKTPTAGVCTGFQSQLEHIDNWRLCSKEEAIEVFQEKSMEDPPPNRSTASSQDASTAHALQNIYLSNVLVYPSKVNEKGRKRKEEQDEEWSCVGSTEVDLLVLRPQHSKEESIVAVSPYCAPGMTVRDVSNPTLGRDRTSTIRLGLVEIVYQSSVTEDDPEEEANTAADSKQNVPNRSKKPSVPSTQTAVATTQKFYSAGKNILKHMQINAELLYQATQEDFANRTYQASQRIVQECGKTLDRMNGLLKKIVSWQDDSNRRG